MKKFIRTKIVTPLLIVLLIFNSITVANGTTYNNDYWSSSDWTTYWQGPAEKTWDGIKIITNATYNSALNSDYYAFDLKIGNLIDNGSWLMFGFENALVDMDGGAASKIRVSLRNNGGKLNVYGVNVTKNQTLVNFVVLNNVNAIGDIHVIFAKDATTNQWYLSINENRFDGGNFNNITTSDFCDGTGNTHLGFASWSDVPVGMTRESSLNYTILSILTDRPGIFVPDYLKSANWATYWQGPAEKTSDGIKIITNATYNQVLKSDYFMFDFKIGNLIDNGSWLVFGLENALVDIDGGAASKIRFYLRNNGGKLNVYGENVTKNQNLVNFILLDTVNAIGDIHIIFANDPTTNKWYLSVNENRFDGGNFNNITTSDFCDGNGSAYLGFASWSDVPVGMTRDAALNYTLTAIVSERPGSNINDIDSSALYQQENSQYLSSININLDGTLNTQGLGENQYSVKFTNGNVVKGNHIFTSLSKNVKGNRYSFWIKSNKYGLVTVSNGAIDVVNSYIDPNVWIKISYNNVNGATYSLVFDTKSENTQAVTLYVDQYVEVVPANFNNYTLLENSMIKFITNTNKLNFTGSVDTIEGASLSIYDNNGDPLSDNELIGTGNILNVSDIQDVSYQAIVLGDVDGNSKIDLEDLVFVRDDLLEVSPLEGIYEKAGDLYGEEDITLNDLVGIMSFVSDTENGGGIENRVESSVTHGYYAWNFGDSTNKFTTLKTASCLSEEGLLYWESTLDDKLISPNNLKIPSSTVHTIDLRMLSTTADKLTLRWRMTGGQFDTVKTATITIISDGKFHDYQIELGQNTNWNGEISQLSFSVGNLESDIQVDFIRLSGIYFVPFPFLTGVFNSDVVILNELKSAFSEANKSVVVGFSAIAEFLSNTNSVGNYTYFANEMGSQGTFNPYYLIRLAKAVKMPVMIWLRGDPWGYSQNGAYGQLRQDNNNLMWTAAKDNTCVYRNNTSGYSYLSLAQKDLNGNQTAYWTKVDLLLKQCAQVVGKLIEENPDDILGVTTTSEYKFNVLDGNADLDYNPRTIAEFKDYCKEKYITTAALNSACGSAINTWALKSTDYNPATVENTNGFDAPRVRNQLSAFWTVWTEFRALQIKKAVDRQVKDITTGIDSKYIYTHQIALGNDPFVSPTSTGNIEGANVGIDMFYNEINNNLFQEISGYVKDDPSRSWGIPEWLIMSTASYDATLSQLTLMQKYKIKYICPFNWGGGDDFDFKNSQGKTAIQDFLKQLG